MSIDSVESMFRIGGYTTKGKAWEGLGGWDWRNAVFMPSEKQVSKAVDRCRGGLSGEAEGTDSRAPAAWKNGP